MWRPAAALAVVAACALSACGSSRPPAARVLIDVVPALPRSLDPADEQGPAFDALESSLGGTLVRGAGSGVAGYLASSWRRVAGGDYVFELRAAGSAYGHTLSGADVRFSFRRELAASATARSLAAAAGIDVGDPVTVLAPALVRVNATAGRSLALAVLADFRFAVLDSRAVRAHASGWPADHLAFYGAYEMTAFVPRRRLLARANPRFGGPAPAFGHLAIEAAPSGALRLADLAAGEASLTSGLDAADLSIAARTSGLRVVTLPAGRAGGSGAPERVVARVGIGGFGACAAGAIYYDRLRG